MKFLNDVLNFKENTYCLYCIQCCATYFKFQSSQFVPCCIWLM